MTDEAFIAYLRATWRNDGGGKPSPHAAKPHPKPKAAKPPARAVADTSDIPM